MIKITYNKSENELGVEINYVKLQQLTKEQADYVEKTVFPSIIQALNKAQILKENKQPSTKKG